MENKNKFEENDNNEAQEAENIIEETQTEELQEVVEDEVNALQDEIAKLKNDMLRVLADTENTKRRLIQEADKNSKYAISSFAKALLPVADNMQRAMEASEPCPLLEGVELTYNELMKAFEKVGVMPMDCLNKPFDPNFHQVISQVADETKEDGTVIQVLQTGYMISDRILREAMVVVSKK